MLQKTVLILALAMQFLERTGLPFVATANPLVRASQITAWADLVRESPKDRLE